jgi:hypothetical protein
MLFRYVQSLAFTIALGLVSSTLTLGAEPAQQWRCERLSGVTDYMDGDTRKTSSDGYDTGSTVRINFATGDVEVYQDDETAQSHNVGGTHATLVARTPTTLTWVEVTKGLAPGVGLYTLFTTEGRVYYSYQRRVMGSGAPAASTFQARCSRQK